MTPEENRFRVIISDVNENGIESSPRGMLIKEINNFSYVLDPYQRFMNYKSRKLNVDYIKYEFLWYLRGMPGDTSICDHAKMWRGLVNEDGTINSNYGQYIFGDQMQFLRVSNELLRDKDSRRASIIILKHDHLESDTKDVPCTYSINFRIRQGRLDMTVHMRSQDAIFGMGNDAPAFSFVHEMMYHHLKEYYKDLVYGKYFHFADSFHIYERHFEMMKFISSGQDQFMHVDCPRINGPDEVRYLMYGEHLYVKSEEGLDIPERFKFTRWLHTYGR